MWFFPSFGIHPREEKLHGAKCYKYFRPEGVCHQPEWFLLGSPQIRMVPPGVAFLHLLEQFVFIVLESQDNYSLCTCNTFFCNQWFWKCNPHRICGFCTRVGLAILESHSIDEYKTQRACVLWVFRKQECLST